MDASPPPRLMNDFDLALRPAYVEQEQKPVAANTLPTETFTPKLSEKTEKEKSGFSIESITLAGGPIFSQHMQSAPNHFNQSHTFISAKISTRDYGSLGAFSLSPNSMRKDSIAVGYITPPLKFSVLGVKAELSGMVGAVTGYVYDVTPMVGANLRVNLFEAAVGNGKMDVGLEVSAMPYLQPAGVVVTSPYLSLRYHFGAKSQAAKPVANDTVQTAPRSAANGPSF